MDGAIVLTGLAFAGDLLVWHLAILKTTVANATFFALMAPVWVVLGSAVLIGEKVGRGGVFGLVLCFGGAAALLGSSYSFAPEDLTGDLYGIATSMFFGAYFMALRVARRRSGTGRIVFLTSVITAPILLAASLIAEQWPAAGRPRRRDGAVRPCLFQPCRRTGLPDLRAWPSAGGLFLAGDLSRLPRRRGPGMAVSRRATRADADRSARRSSSPASISRGRRGGRP